MLARRGARRGRNHTEECAQHLRRASQTNATRLALIRRSHPAPPRSAALLPAPLRTGPEIPTHLPTTAAALRAARPAARADLRDAVLPPGAAQRAREAGVPSGRGLSPLARTARDAAGAARAPRSQGVAAAWRNKRATEQWYAFWLVLGFGGGRAGARGRASGFGGGAGCRGDASSVLII
ncbi:hypothetical protein DSL72_008042 [Monilinia vaccinii-corymbosi]|uniref:Uncharacterized protein n=1 Tax=Monilinia vaccinii-corymbosi TaxID=61207 RepID=A0A8A3PJJ4_9HELO|nr:hypothetical protein DSL72_008042 [Monilinia vaccinii-corymbosi]